MSIQHTCSKSLDARSQEPGVVVLLLFQTFECTRSTAIIIWRESRAAQPIRSAWSHALHAPLKAGNNENDGYRVTLSARPITGDCSHGCGFVYEASIVLCSKPIVSRQVFVNKTHLMSAHDPDFFPRLMNINALLYACRTVRDKRSQSQRLRKISSKKSFLNAKKTWPSNAWTVLFT